MDISIFDVTGPVMVGPSSSHTAGAVRLGRAAKEIYGGNFDQAAFGLHGSFAETYQGHGTDLALLSGVMGLSPDDEQICHVFELARQGGLSYRFYKKELEHVHENAVQIKLFDQGMQVFELIGSSIGGGRIMLNEINGCRVEFTAEQPTMIVEHQDVRGMISRITGVLAEARINVGTLKLTRENRGETAWSIIETDEAIPLAVTQKIADLPHVISARTVWVR